MKTYGRYFIGATFEYEKLLATILPYQRRNFTWEFTPDGHIFMSSTDAYIILVAHWAWFSINKHLFNINRLDEILAFYKVKRK